MFSDRSWASSMMTVSYCSRSGSPCGLGQQDAVGHKLDKGLGADRFGEADLKAHVVAQGRAEFFGDPRGHAAGGNAPRLRMADQSVDAAAQLQADLGQLRRLARAGFAANDHHLVLANGGGDVRPPGGNRQVRIERQFGRHIR